MKKLLFIFLLLIVLSPLSYARDRLVCYSDFHFDSLEELVNRDVRSNEQIAGMYNITQGGIHQVCVVFRTNSCSGAR